MKKAQLGWWLLGTVEILIAVVGGVLMWQKMDAAPQKAAVKVTATKKVATSRDLKKKNSSREATTASQSTTNKLTATNIGPRTLALAITYYASHHFDQIGAHTWQSMYQAYLTNPGTIIVSNAHVDELKRPGTGVAYYAAFQGGDKDVESDMLGGYPCYTLENNQMVNIYQPQSNPRKSITVSVNQIVQYANQTNQAKKISQLGQQMTIKNLRKDFGANHISIKEFYEEPMMTKVIMYYGIHHDTDKNWQALSQLIKDGTVFKATPDRGTSIIGYNGNSSSCMIAYDPQNSMVGKPDLFVFGHETVDQDFASDTVDGDDVGVPAETLLKYVNDNGGRTAVANIQVKDDSDAIGSKVME
ncbi:hypothetical protein [Lactiplantibacillus pentosus]|uniref:hypothetical protein n=1 Tax=Lactiplantibacillus pentosus TaxID=1589 RepID=UPI001ADDDFB7|nr:hypothetical protein [Lactiplantibacillus pentosus]MBO9163609.1 hypothetical protein [Lactiplantibacillus pentosus]MCT3310816.1 hypothetical protein [Lactiplantibacillus pentosus]